MSRNSQQILVEIANNITTCDIKITATDNFEIKNGILGLDRDGYLSIVKFLNPLTVRKV
jgi:hypothetical protein